MSSRAKRKIAVLLTVALAGSIVAKRAGADKPDEPSAWSLRGIVRTLNPWSAAERLSRPIRSWWPWGDEAELPTEPEPILESPPPQADAEQVPLKIESMQYLATLDPDRYPEVVEALLASLDDSAEDVRHAALEALRGVLNRQTHRCRGSAFRDVCPSCRREQLALRRLEQSLLEFDANGQLKEDSTRNRQLALGIIETFAGRTAPSEPRGASATEPKPVAPAPPPPVAEALPAAPAKPASAAAPAAPRTSRRTLPGLFKPKFRLPGTSKAKEEPTSVPPEPLPGRAQAVSDEELLFVPLDAGPKPAAATKTPVVPPRPPAVKHQTGYRSQPAEKTPANLSAQDDTAGGYRPRWSP